MFFAALLLCGLFIVIIGLPCVGVGIMGTKLANRIANHPSKTPAIQMTVLFKLVILETISFGLLMMVYHILADYGG